MWFSEWKRWKLKAAIESLSGGEKQSFWMIKNMHHNKVFKYKSQNKSDNEKKVCSRTYDIFAIWGKLEKATLRSFKNKLYGNRLRKNNFLHYASILK